MKDMKDMKELIDQDVRFNKIKVEINDIIRDMLDCKDYYGLLIFCSNIETYLDRELARALVTKSAIRDTYRIESLITKFKNSKVIEEDCNIDFIDDVDRTFAICPNYSGAVFTKGKNRLLTLLVSSTNLKSMEVFFSEQVIRTYKCLYSKMRLLRKYLSRASLDKHSYEEFCRDYRICQKYAKMLTKYDSTRKKKVLNLYKMGYIHPFIFGTAPKSYLAEFRRIEEDMKELYI